MQVHHYVFCRSDPHISKTGTVGNLKRAGHRQCVELGQTTLVLDYSSRVNLNHADV